MRVLLVCSLVLLGCSGSDVSRIEDRGSVCVRSAADGTLSVEVTFAASCSSSSCTEVRESECSVEAAGREIRVQSRAQLEDLARPGRDDCTNDCMRVSAVCAIGSLEAGTYTLTHGARRAEVTVPGRPLALFSDESQFPGACE